MALMKFVEKCPKCGGFVQTKSVRKSIGLGFVEIPVAQFCLNPVCDWYQDFTESRKPGEIKEGFRFRIPDISGKQLIAMAAVIGFILIYALFTYFIPSFYFGDAGQKPQAVRPELQENLPAVTSGTPAVPVIVPASITAIQTPVIQSAIIEPENFTVRIDVSHGFYPDSITINRSDSIIWSNQENQRPRIVLVSKDDLFEKQLLQYPGRFQYQFNKEGKYSFAIAEYPSDKEYRNATGSVIVR